MNKIITKLEKSEYSSDRHLTINIDGKPLDIILHELYPEKNLIGLVPTLLTWLYNDLERKFVWNRIESEYNQVVPILMCPEDVDLWCTVIVVEIEKKDEIVTWKRMGLEDGSSDKLEDIGKEVEWLDKIQMMQFNKKEYEEFILKFKKEFEYEKLKKLID